MIGPYDVTLQYGRLFAELRDARSPRCPAAASPSTMSRRWPKPISPPPITAYRPALHLRRRGGDLSPPVRNHRRQGLSPRSAPDRAARLLIAYGWADEAIASLTGTRRPQINPGMASI